MHMRGTPHQLCLHSRLPSLTSHGQRKLHVGRRPRVSIPGPFALHACLPSSSTNSFHPDHRHLSTVNDEDEDEDERNGEESNDVTIKETDLEEQFVRGSGPGGQKINKSSVCVVRF